MKTILNVVSRVQFEEQKQKQKINDYYVEIEYARK